MMREGDPRRGGGAEGSAGDSAEMKKNTCNVREMENEPVGSGKPPIIIVKREEEEGSASEPPPSQDVAPISAAMSYIQAGCWGAFCCEGHEKPVKVGSLAVDIRNHYQRNHPMEKKMVGRKCWTAYSAVVRECLEKKRRGLREGDLSILDFLSNPLEKNLHGFRCPVCKSVFNWKQNAKRHVKVVHRMANVSFESCVPIFKSGCGRWIDVHATMEDYPRQADALSNALGLEESDISGNSPIIDDDKPEEKGHFTVGWKCGGSCDFICLDEQIMSMHRGVNGCSGTKRKDAMWVHGEPDVALSGQQKRIRLATQAERRKIYVGKDQQIHQKYPRYLESDRGYFRMGWTCGEPCGRCFVTQSTLNFHRAGSKCEGSPQHAMLYVSDPGGLKWIHTSRIRLATKEEILRIDAVCAMQSMKHRCVGKHSGGRKQAARGEAHGPPTRAPHGH